MAALTVHHPDPDNPLALYERRDLAEHPNFVVVELDVARGDLQIDSVPGEVDLHMDGEFLDDVRIGWNLALGWVPIPAAASNLLDQIAPHARNILTDVHYDTDHFFPKLGDTGQHAVDDITQLLWDTPLRDDPAYYIATMDAEDWFMDGNDDARDGMDITCNTSDSRLALLAQQEQAAALAMHEPSYLAGLASFLDQLRSEAPN